MIAAGSISSLHVQKPWRNCSWNAQVRGCRRDLSDVFTYMCTNDWNLLKRPAMIQNWSSSVNVWTIRLLMMIQGSQLFQTCSWVRVWKCVGELLPSFVEFSLITQCHKLRLARHHRAIPADPPVPLISPSCLFFVFFSQWIFIFIQNCLEQTKLGSSW